MRWCGVLGLSQATLAAFEGSGSSSGDVVWRHARACYKLAQELLDPKDAGRKKELTYESLGVAKVAITEVDGSGHAAPGPSH